MYITKTALLSVPNGFVATLYPSVLAVQIFPILSPLHIHHLQCPCCCPYPLQVQTILFLPPLVHQLPRVLLYHQTQIYDESGRDEIFNGVMDSGDVYLHLL